MLVQEEREAWELPALELQMERQVVLEEFGLMPTSPTKNSHPSWT
jgi:hypothetical protein